MTSWKDLRADELEVGIALPSAGLRPFGQALAALSAYATLALLLRLVWFPHFRLDEWLPPGQWPHDAALNAYLLTHSAPAFLRGGVHAMLQTNAYFPTPDTLLLTEPMLGWSLLAWPLLAAGLAPLAAHNTLWTFALVGNAMGCFLLARYITRHAGAAFLAGIPAGFGAWPWFEGPRIQIVFLGAAALVLLSLEQVARKPTLSNCAGLAVSFGAQLLLGFYQSLFIATASACWLVTRCLVYGWKHAFARRSLLCTAAVMVACLLVASPLLRPYLGSQQLIRTTDYAQLTAPTLRDLTCVDVSASWLWGAVLSCRPAAMGSHFPGFVTAILAIGALYSARRRRDAATLHYALLAVVLTVVMLGPGVIAWPGISALDPYALLYRYVPGWKSVRFPGRLGGIQLVCVSVVAAAGAAAAAQFASRLRHGATLVIAVLTVASVAELVPAPARYEAPEPIDPQPAYAVFLRDVPGKGAVVELPTKMAAPPEPARDALAMLASVTHGRPTLNGHLGEDPEGYFFTAVTLDGFPGAEAIATARRLGARFVVVHGPRFLLADPTHSGALVAARARAAAAQPAAGFKVAAIFPDDGVEVYDIGPPVDPDAH